MLFRYWDKAPQGFEHLTPGQYKAMQAAGQLPTRVLGLTPTANIAAQYPMAGGYFTRQGISLFFSIFTYLFLARRLYIGGVPFGATEDAMMEFFNQQMHMAGESSFQITIAFIIFISKVWQLVQATLSWPFKLIWIRISLFLKFDQLMKPLLLWHSTVSILWDSHLRLDDLLIIKLFQVT